MDSNRKVINFSRLWKANEPKCLNTATLSDVYTAIQNTDMNSITCLLIHCGTNDIEMNSVESVFQRYIELVSIIKSKFKGTIIISELLLWNDKFDRSAEDLNNQLKEHYEADNAVLVVHHKNIRRQGISVLRDQKHLNNNISGLFASNLRFGLKRAFPQSNFSRNRDKQAQVKSKVKDSKESQLPRSTAFNKRVFCNGLLDAIREYFDTIWVLFLMNVFIFPKNFMNKPKTKWSPDVYIRHP